MTAASIVDNGRIALIGAPSSAGARRAGQELGPGGLRRAGLAQALSGTGWDVLDLGDLPTVTFSPDPGHPRAQNLERVVSVVGGVRDAVDTAFARRAWPLVIGGDCTITIGVLAALAGRTPRPGLLYFDADLDWNTPETTPSGIFDGMVLAHVLGGGAEQLNHLGPRHPLLEASSVTLFGYNERGGGTDPIEIERLRRSRVARYPLERVRDAPRAAAREALTALGERTEHILLHFDLDVIDPADFPAVDVPHTSGLPLAAARDVLEVFVASPQVAGFVITEFNAALDPEGRYGETVVGLIASAMAGRSRGRGQKRS